MRQHSQCCSICCKLFLIWWYSCFATIDVYTKRCCYFVINYCLVHIANIVKQSCGMTYCICICVFHCRVGVFGRDQWVFAIDVEWHIWLHCQYAICFGLYTTEWKFGINLLDISGAFDHVNLNNLCNYFKQHLHFRTDI